MQKVLSEPRTRELLRRLVIDRKPLEPIVGPDGQIHYALADEVLGAHADTNSWILQMLDLGMLRRSRPRELVMCPEDLRVDPLIQFECTKCKERAMRKSTLVEHVPCGYIEANTKFNKEGILTCPNCKKPILKPEELKSSGVWFECQKCGAKTGTPKVVFTCREGHEFGTLDVLLATAYAYEVNESVTAQLVNALVLIPSIGEMLTSMGYTVSYPASVQGKSGTKHPLDIYAKSVEEDIAIQIAPDTKPVEPTAVISFFAKTYDIRPKLAILIAIPSASEAAKQINSGYDIVIVEDKDGGGAVQKVRDLLGPETRERQSR